jgi:UDP-2,3-diacylglucosamine hydrolase
MSARLAFVGDVHLEPHDPLLPEFLEFLSRLGEECSRIVFTGDLFTVWLGREELEQPHHAAVLERLRELKERGVAMRYIEGNHDFRIADSYIAEVFEEVVGEALTEAFGGRNILAAHGDLANSADRRYRRWRRFARSPMIWGLFNVLPPRARMRLAETAEKRMRSTNLAHKRIFPEEQVLAYASAFLQAGHDTVVLGHFHEEHDLTLPAKGGAGRLIVLPEWKGSRRHLEAKESGELRFVDHRPAGS